METAEDVINLRKDLYARSLADKIAKDTAQFNLREVYKPLLEGQKEQTEKLAKAQQNMQDARAQDLTQKHEELINEIRKQPYTIPLIKSLNNNPKIIDVINGKSDGSDLTGREQNILKEVDKVDDRVLRTLIEFYSTPRSETLIESGIETMLSREPMDEEQQVAKDMFDEILQMKDDPKKEETRLALKELFDKRENQDKLLTYLDTISYQFDLNRYPYTVIKRVNPDLYNEVKELRKQKMGKGCRSNVKFLSSDPNELFKKLHILIAEKEAGNNNVLNEASAITDELRRLGLLSVGEIKNIYKLIAK